jgi:hypothetical protein
MIEAHECVPTVGATWPASPGARVPKTLRRPSLHERPEAVGTTPGEKTPCAPTSQPQPKF